MTVLIIEDNRDTAVMLAKLIQCGDKQCETTICETVQCGRDSITRKVPDYILLDLMLPDEPGEHLIDYCIENKVPSRIIVMSAAPIARLEALSKYPNIRTISKPFSPAHFLYIRNLHV